MAWRPPVTRRQRSAVVAQAFHELASSEMSRAAVVCSRRWRTRCLAPSNSRLDAVHAATRLREFAPRRAVVSRRRASRGANGDPLRTRSRSDGKTHRLGLSCVARGYATRGEAWQILMSHATEALLEEAAARRDAERSRRANGGVLRPPGTRLRSSLAARSPSVLGLR